MGIVVVFFFIYFIALHTSLAAMEIAVWLVVLPSVFLAFRQKKLILPSKPVLIAFAGLLSAAIISFFININNASEFVDYIGEFRWMLLYCGLLQFYSVFYQRLDFHKLILTGQIVLIIAGFYSIYQFFTAHDLFRSHVVFHYIYDGSKYFRPNSFFGLPTTYGYASAMFFSMALVFWMREKRAEPMWKVSIRRFYFIMGPFNIFLTFTRAAWLACMASSLMILKRTNTRYFYRAALAFAIMITALYTSFPSFTNRVNSIFDTNYNANENRIYLWKANIDIFKQNPFFGLGFDENRKQIDTYLKPYNRPWIMRNHPHNTYLNFLAGLGIFGLGFLLLFFGYNIKTCIDGMRTSTNSMHKTLFMGILGVQIVLMIGGITECCFEDLELCHQYILFMALAEYLKSNYGVAGLET